MNRIPPFVATLLVAQMSALHAADAPKPELKPGTRMILKFPDLPQTLYAMQSGQEAVTQVYLALPENYSPERKFPLFVFLYGGHGGPGAGPGRGQQIMENEDCIFVNLPLFKNKSSKWPACRPSKCLRFVGKLQSIPDGGGTLLDHCLITFGSAMGDGRKHDHGDLSCVVAGHAGGALKGGQYLRMKDETPMANLFVTTAHLAGTKLDRFGDSTGALTLG